MLSMVEEPDTKLVYFMGIDKAKFRKPVVPGDQLRFELEMLKMRAKTCKMKGKAFVDDKLVAEAELTSVVVGVDGVSSVVASLVEDVRPSSLQPLVGSRMLIASAPKPTDLTHW